MTDTPKPKNDRLSKLQAWRGPHPPDLSMSFLRDQFKREVEKPYKQLEQLVEIWTRLVPPELCRYTKLEALNRGVLKVAVDSSARHYELDRLLRQGLQEQIIKMHKGPAFRKIQIHVGESAAFVESPPPSKKRWVEDGELEEG